MKEYNTVFEVLCVGKHSLPVKKGTKRSLAPTGVVGPLQELSGANAGQVYSGSQHQYEFIENMRGNGWKEYFNENNVITYELK